MRAPVHACAHAPVRAQVVGVLVIATWVVLLMGTLFSILKVGARVRGRRARGVCGSLCCCLFAPAPRRTAPVPHPYCERLRSLFQVSGLGSFTVSGLKFCSVLRASPQDTAFGPELRFSPQLQPSTLIPAPWTSQFFGVLRASPQDEASGLDQCVRRLEGGVGRGRARMQSTHPGRMHMPHPHAPRPPSPPPRTLAHAHTPTHTHTAPPYTAPPQLQARRLGL
jgi:hypothetical protein